MCSRLNRYSLIYCNCFAAPVLGTSGSLCSACLNDCWISVDSDHNTESGLCFHGLLWRRLGSAFCCYRIICTLGFTDAEFMIFIECSQSFFDFVLVISALYLHFPSFHSPLLWDPPSELNSFPKTNYHLTFQTRSSFQAFALQKITLKL